MTNPAKDKKNQNNAYEERIRMMNETLSISVHTVAPRHEDSSANSPDEESEPSKK